MTSGFRTVVLVPPQQEPVTLAQVKSHCRIIINEDDSYLTDLVIPAARDRAERYLRRYLCEQTIRVVYDMFSSDVLTIPVGPVRRVSLISYQDDQNVTQTLSASLYNLDISNEPVRIYPAFNQYWPSLSGHPAAINIDLVVGYPPGGAGSPTDFAANIPPAIKQGILLDCAHLYENRESVNIGNITSEIPLGWDSLMWPYRLMT